MAMQALPQHQSLSPKFIQTLSSQNSITKDSTVPSSVENVKSIIQNQKHAVYGMIDERKKQNQEKKSKQFDANYQEESNRTRIKGEYSKYIQTKQQMLNEAAQKQDQSPEKEDHSLLQSQAIPQSIFTDSTLQFSQSPPNGQASSLQKSYPLVRNFQSPKQNPQNPNHQLILKPERLAQQSLGLFQPFGSHDYQKKLKNLEQAYQSPLTKIKERSSSATYRLPGQKIEDRLLDLGKQREIYLKKLQDYYTSRELQEIRAKPEINPRSILIAQHILDSDLYEREKEFISH